MGLSCLQATYSLPVTGDAQHRDGECITEIGDGDHIGIVLQLCIAIAVFCWA